MSTIFVLLKDGQVMDVAPTLAADEALRFFQQGSYYNGNIGQIFACHMSESAAFEVRAAFLERNPKTPASVLVKRYSSYLNHVGDVT